MPTGGGAVPGAPSAPPEVTDLEIKGEVDPRLERAATRQETFLEDIESGRTREADVFRSEMESDMEQQIASAKESALAAGRPWTAQDESRMRSELKRGQYGAEAEFTLGQERQRGEQYALALGGQKAPFESQMAEKGLSAATQQMLMDYAIGRGGLVSEDKKTAVMEAGLAIDAYKAFLAMLGGGGSFDFSSSYG